MSHLNNFQFKKDTTPLWTDTENMPAYSPLNQDLEVDVCIVGGGVAGLTTAYLLANHGKKVCVLEMLRLCEGQTGRTSAHLVTALDRRYEELISIHGKSKTRLAAESHRAAIEKIESICQLENIQCDFQYVEGVLSLAPDSAKDLLKKEHQACLDIGLSEVYLSDNTLRFPRQAQFHPLKYILGLLKALDKKGVQVFEETLVQDIKDGDPAIVVTSYGQTVRAQSVVVCTNSPINNTVALHTKQAPYRSYVIGGLIPKNTLSGLWWDTAKPFHYVRSQNLSEHNDVLIVGGEDHKTGQNENPEECFTRLELWARQHFPQMQEVIYSWSGQVMETIDGLAYLGRNIGDKNIYVITGDSGNGLTHSTIGAMLITDQIQGLKNHWEDLYSPSRIHLASIKEFMKENLNVAAQYMEWLTPHSIESLDLLPQNEGTVLNLGFKKIAVYKNEHGILDFHSAVCPHLGCVVAWNGVEKSWDCPCHGSRFDCHGKVVEGPAQSDLAQLDAPKDDVIEGTPLTNLERIKPQQL